MSEEFKGKQGGDPSRRPPLVTIAYQCLFCLKDCEAVTRKPDYFDVPNSCSNECEAALIREKAKLFVREILGESDVPERGDIPQRIAEEVIQAHRWLQKAENREVKIVSIVCAHCKKPADKFAFSNSKVKNGPSIYCSFACRESKATKLPKGVICRSPRKESHPNAKEAREVADKLNRLLILEGDTEGVAPYACTCGRWHTGHQSKLQWLEAASAAIAILNEKTTALAQQ
jgi:hypothetical protein